MHLLVEHPLEVDVGRGGWMLSLIVVVVAVAAAVSRGGCYRIERVRRNSMRVRRIVHVGNWLIRAHHLGAEFAESALTWIDLSLIVLDTDPDD